MVSVWTGSTRKGGRVRPRDVKMGIAIILIYTSFINFKIDLSLSGFSCLRYCDNSSIFLGVKLRREGSTYWDPFHTLKSQKSRRFPPFILDKTDIVPSTSYLFYQ